MYQIILKLNLKYILSALSLQQKGLLLDALLNTDEDDEPAPEVIAKRVQNDDVVANLYKYIFLLQKDINAKQQRMRELGAKGGASRKKDKNMACEMPLLDLWQGASDSSKVSGEGETSDISGASDGSEMSGNITTDEVQFQPQPITNNADNLAFDDKKQALLLMQNDKESSSETDACLSSNGACSDNKASLKPKRKVTKEKFLNIKNNFMAEKILKKSAVKHQKHVPKEGTCDDFIPPSVAEVQAYVEENGFLVKPNVFVDFYEARDWYVGRTAIKKWKPIVKLWHERAVEGKSNRTSGNEKTVGSFSSAVDDETYWSALEEKVKAQGDASMVDENITPQPVTMTEEERSVDKQLSPSAVGFRLENSNNSDERKDLTALQNENTAQNSVSSLVGKFDSDILSAPQTSAQSLMNDYAGLSPFTRFMRRIEDYDLSPEEKK